MEVIIYILLSNQSCTSLPSSSYPSVCKVLVNSAFEGKISCSSSPSIGTSFRHERLMVCGIISSHAVAIHWITFIMVISFRNVTISLS